MGLGWPWWVTVPVAILGAALFGTLIGLISVRTEGIYTIMITLAIAVAFFYFVRQNYDLFNGFNGYAGVAPPTLLGIYWRSEEHTSELQSLMRISYADFCLKKKNNINISTTYTLI